MRPKYFSPTTVLSCNESCKAHGPNNSWKIKSRNKNENDKMSRKEKKQKINSRRSLRRINLDLG